MWPPCPRTSSLRSATGASASSSSSSTCSPTSRRGATSSCRWCTRASSPPSADERALAALDRVGLADRADHRPDGALRRPAAARGHRPGAGDRARPAPRRRAHRQPRLGVHGGRAGPPRGPARQRPHDRPDHPRARRRRARRTRRADQRRPGERERGGARELARHPLHRLRRRPHPPPAVGADDAGDPDRDHRGDPHRRHRPGRPGRRAGPDRRAGHQRPRRVAGQLDRRLRRPRRLRHGVDPHDGRRRGAGRRCRRPRRRGGRGDRHQLGVAERRRDQLDHHADRHHTVVAGRPVESDELGTVLDRDRGGRRRLGHGVGPRHRDRAGPRRRPGRPDGHV